MFEIVSPLSLPEFILKELLIQGYSAFASITFLVFYVEYLAIEM